MAGTTYNDLYNLAKNNEVYFQYDKGGDLGTINIRGTLKRELIPDSGTDLHLYEIAIAIGDWQLAGGLIADLPQVQNPSPDDDSAARSPILELAARAMAESNNNPPEWFKFYSTNYNTWVNLRVADISNLQVVGV